MRRKVCASVRLRADSREWCEVIINVLAFACTWVWVCVCVCVGAGGPEEVRLAAEGVQEHRGRREQPARLAGTHSARMRQMRHSSLLTLTPQSALGSTFLRTRVYWYSLITLCALLLRSSSVLTRLPSLPPYTHSIPLPLPLYQYRVYAARIPADSLCLYCSSIIICSLVFSFTFSICKHSKMTQLGIRVVFLDTPKS